MHHIIIAVDGFSGCGKSTTAKAVAQAMSYTYIDSGAMYRAVTLYFKENYVTLTNPKEVVKALENINISFIKNTKINRSDTCLNGVNVEDEIRKMYISENVSQVSALPEVRKAMVAQQQKMGKKGGVVMDGRDIGTTVFPNAELKIFVVADMMVRAQRRQQELLEKKQMVTLDEIIENLTMRDHIDSTRTESPLRKADDAFELDTTYLSIEEQVEIVVRLATEKMIDKHRMIQQNLV
ncbi:MAG: (d)CMP kinase [Cytophagales bacterium]